ncbi:MAG: ABC transporter permease [Candidatus Acidiferrum sp.]|jgi:predicted permease
MCGRKRKVDDFSAEIDAHLHLEFERQQGLGLSEEDAWAAARRVFGNVTQAKERFYESGRWLWWDHFRQDVRYGMRMLRKSPGFAVIAILTLAIGIGANTALFSVVNGVLLNPLPYAEPHRLVALFAKSAQFDKFSISYPNFLDWSRQNHSFSSLAAFRGETFTMTGMGEPERVDANMVSATFFPLLGMNPMIGRNFEEKQDQLGAGRVALIGEGLWKRKFGSALDIAGKSITLDGNLYTITGVIPAAFHFQNDNYHSKAEVYVPLGQWNNPLFRDRRTGMGMDAVGRLKPGVSLAQAKSDMDGVASHLAEVYPEIDKGQGITLIPLKQNLVGDIQPFLLMLLAAVGFVLLIACVNVANLLLARSTGRNREFAIRNALGASIGRVVRQLLTECVLLALMGGALGTLMAAWGTKAALKWLPEALPRSDEIHLDARVLMLTFGASVLAGILFGLVPAFKSARSDIQGTLRESGRGLSGARHRTQSTFVAMEMALAVVLLVAAGLMIRSIGKIWGVDPGFDPNHVAFFSFSTAQPLGATPDTIRQSYRQIHDAIAAVPGVESVSLSGGSTPMYTDSELPFWLEGEAKPASQADMKLALFFSIQPDYLKVMKIPLKRGRFLTQSDTSGAPFVIVIDERFAKQVFGNEDPIGKHINFAILNQTAEVVGIAGHQNQWGLDSDATSAIQAQCYFSIEQMPDSLLSAFDRGANGMVRTSYAQTDVAPSLSRAMQIVSSDAVVYDVESMNGIISDSLATKRFAMSLLAVFAVLAIVLSSVGIYGVISYIVGQRTHEIGIRMALGAERSTVVTMVLRQAGQMAAFGVVAGLLAAGLLGRLMASMLFGVSFYDALTFSTVAAILLAAALAACWIPARRASRVDPMVALRYE